jgi:hypothetical protein
MTAAQKKQINDLLDAEVRTHERAMRSAALKAIVTLAAQTSKKSALEALNKARDAVAAIPLSKGEA